MPHPAFLPAMTEHGYNHSVTLDLDKCKGCTACMRKCPVGAITGKVKEVHVLDADKCISCGSCADTCPVGAPQEA